MRIGVNTRVLLKGRMEGVCRYIHETTKRLVLSHPNDEFYFFFDRTFHPSFIYADNVTPIVISPPTRDPILWKVWFEYSLPRALKKHEIDVFYSGDTYASLKTDVPTVLVSHDIAYHHFPEHLPSRVLKYYKKYFPKFHHKAERLIAVSEFTKQDIIKAYNLEEGKVDVAYNSVPEGFEVMSEDAKQHVRNKYTGGDPFFIYLGSLHPRKNILKLIQAFDLFKRKNKNYKLVLFGRKAWKMDDIENQIRKSPYRNSIIHLDGNKLDPRSVLPAAEALCYVSLLEGFGIPLLEAMSCDVPVITSEKTATSEVASDAALLANPYDSNSISQAMQTIVSNEEIRNGLVVKGRIRIKQFDWQKSADVIYKNLISAASS